MALRLRKLDIEIRRERQEKEKNLRAQLIDENEKIKLDRETALDHRVMESPEVELEEWEGEEGLKEWEGGDAWREGGGEVVDDGDLGLGEGGGGGGELPYF